MPTEFEYKIEIEGTQEDASNIHNLLKENNVENKILQELSEIDITTIIITTLVVISSGLQAIDILKKWYEEWEKIHRRKIKINIVTKNGTRIDIDSHTAEDIKLKLRE